MMKSDKVYIDHIVTAINNIENYMRGKTYEEFSNDKMLQDAVIRNIEIIGEASKKISEDTKNEFPEIMFKDASKMRDKLIHDYFGVDIDIVYSCVTDDIPNLRNQLLYLKDKI